MGQLDCRTKCKMNLWVFRSFSILFRSVIVNRLIQQPAHELTEEEQWAEEHRKMHEKHKGHEAMHMEMMIILIITLIVGQIFLVQWKRRHFKSYQVRFHIVSCLVSKTFHVSVLHPHRNVADSCVRLRHAVLVPISGYMGCLHCVFSICVDEGICAAHQWSNTEVGITVLNYQK